MFGFIVLTGLASLLFAFYLYVTSNSNYWKIRNVPHEKPVPILGSYADYILQKKYLGYASQSLCKKFPNAPYIGTFFGTDPALLVQDPEILKLIFTKDFAYFSGRELNEYTQKETYTKNIFSLGGDDWKLVRHNVTPLFTSTKMKKMYYLIENCAFQLETLLEDMADDVVEMKGLMTRFTMGCMGSCVFGVDTKTLEKQNPNEKNRFTEMGHLMLTVNFLQSIIFMTRTMWPALFYSIGFKTFPKQFTEYFDDFIGGVFKSRDYKPSTRNDFIDFLLGFRENKIITADSLINTITNEKKKVEFEVTDDWLMAQCFVFFGAGFETSSSALTWTFYELAKNKKAQRRAQEEVDAYLKRHNNTMTYDCIKEFPYLEACLEETIRMYPVLGNLTREVMHDYKLPDGLVLEKGLRIHIPVYAIHRNPEHFPDPESYIPERFLGENRQKVKPYTYMPFGEGPRTCIGARFAKMEIMPGLISVLKKFDLELAPGMPSKITLEAKSLVAQPKGYTGVLLKMKVREGADSRRFDRSVSAEVSASGDA